MKEAKHLVKLVRDGKTHYSEWDNFSQAESYCKGVEIGAECTIYAEVKKYDKYSTLREYLKQHEAGAYSTFEFVMPYYNAKIPVSVDGVWSFEKIYQPNLLDMFYVIKDDKTERGPSPCDSYHCTHKLELKMIDKEQDEK